MCGHPQLLLELCNHPSGAALAKCSPCQPSKGDGRSKMKKHMRQHHAQQPELPVFYNIHSVSNFISLANSLLVEIIEAWKSKAMEEISKLWNVRLLSKRVPISNHIKKGVWKDNQDFGQLNVFLTFSLAQECSARGMSGVAAWLIAATLQTSFFSCRLWDFLLKYLYCI